MLIPNYAIKFRTAVFVFIAVITLLGAISYNILPREGAPDITIPYVFVTTLYEGTAPEEMEKLVTAPMERQFNDVDRVKTIQSTTVEGVSSIVIEFQSGADMDMSLQRVKDKVDLARPELPPDLDEPMVQAMNFSTDVPVYIFALSGAEAGRLKNLAEDLKEAIELVGGVRQATISGTREREIRVELDLNRLIALGIPLDGVMQRIASENKTVSAGNLEIEGNRFQVRVPGEYKLPGALGDILLMDRPGGPIFLRDVATIKDTFKDLDSISRLNGDPCVSIEIRKRNRENTVKLIDEIKRVIAGFNLPPDVRMTSVLDESEYVKMMIAELENNIVSGFILVLVVILFSMGLRNSIFVASAIPFSMLITFTLMQVWGYTLNMIVLFSLVLALGMLVDNAIVIVENIFRLRTTGLSRTEAARQGAAEMAWPIITSTLTTCVAFAPLLFWPDIMGQFMAYLPLTLIVTLSASLFVGLVINPALCSVLISGKTKGVPMDAFGVKNTRLVRIYTHVLRGAHHHRIAVIVTSVLFLIASFQFYAHFGKGRELFPDVDPRNAAIKVQFPQGTAIERTDAVIRQIEALLPDYEDIIFYLSTVGQASGNGMSQGSKATSVGQIHVEFRKFEDRQRPSTELINAIRARLPLIPGAEITIKKQEEGPPTGAPVSIEISGDDFDALADLSGRIIRAIENVPGLVDLQDDFEEALPELQFVVDRHRAALLNLDTATIGHFIRTALYGMEAGKLRPDEDEFDITVRLPLDQRNSTALFDRIYIPLPGGQSVALSSLGEVRYEGGRGAITRKDQKRMITISGNDNGRGVDKIIKDVTPIVDQISLPRGYTIRYAGDTEEMRKSGVFLARAFLIAIGLILVILVVQFNSVLLPLIIGVSILLSLIGVTWGLLLTGTKFGVIMTGMGVISLAGVVINNAIVLIDCIAKRRAAGMPREDAVVTAGRMRLRPVLLTAVTTILGLIPMAIGFSLEVHTWPPRIVAGAESTAWWAPMAIAVIFGLAVSTFLTLVIIPVLYSLFDEVATRMRARFAHPDTD